MGIGTKIGLATGTVALGAAVLFTGNDIMTYFNAHASDPTTQSVTRIFGAAAGGIGAFAIGCVKLVKPELKERIGIVTAPIALVVSLIIGGIGGYGGYRGANTLIDYAVANNTKAPGVAVPKP